MKTYFSNPDFYFYWFDIALSMCLYVIAVVLFLKHKRGYITPLLLFGLFIFPLGFSIWFLSDKINLVVPFQINPLKIFYLLFIKFCLLLSIVFSKK